MLERFPWGLSASVFLSGRSLTIVALLAPVQLAAVIVALESGQAGYDPWQRSISELAIGPHGWILRASFLTCGLGELGLAWVVQSRLRAGERAVEGQLLGLVALCLLALSVFPAYRDQPAWPAFLHIAAFGVGALALIGACCYLSSDGRDRLPVWFGRYSQITAGVSAIALLGLAIHGGMILFHRTSPFVHLAGGLERFGAGIMGLWLEVLAVCVLIALGQVGHPLPQQAGGGEQ